MTLTDELVKYRKNLNRIVESHVPVQTVWAKVKSVDWGKKTMVATGVVDDLDYFDVLLGLGQPVTIEGGEGQSIIGHKLIKPKAGSLCLLGIINNQEAASYLINAVEVEEEVITIGEDYSLTAKNVYVDAESTVFNGGGNGGLVIDAKADINLDKIKSYVQALQGATRVAVTALESLVGGPGTLTTPFDNSMLLVDMNFEDMENGEVKH